jgi:hypothetical protein
MTLRDTRGLAASIVRTPNLPGAKDDAECVRTRAAAE